MYLLTGLRIIVGWHLLYEGIAKLMSPGWSAELYLENSRWILAGFFQWMASEPGLLQVVDFLNIWGLILIGFLLFVGLAVRWASIAGSVLLLFYVLSYPPIPGYTFGTVTEGSYLWVNKNLIELFILMVMAVLPASYFFGADRLIARWKAERAMPPVPEKTAEGTSLKRREILRDLISVPFLGAFAYAIYRKKKWDSFEEKYLSQATDATSGATLKSFSFASLDDLKDQVPKGRIADLEVSRLILGGNLIGGWAHARDLIYASSLVKAYHTDEKVMQTLQLAEKCGINVLLTNPALARVINKYWHETGGKIRFFSDCGGRGGFAEGIRKSEEAGAAAMYCQGGMTDRMVSDGEFDKIAEGLEMIRRLGKPAGIGAHLIETVQACVKQGLKPDFWVKTLHHLDYWSARVDTERTNHLEKGFKDNIYCFRPQETIDFMNELEEPWIAFKVLAAGAIRPGEGFRYAFEGGADFICVGMYDFQLVEDCNIALDTLSGLERTRPWRG
jgi:uncharacterized membrane protein YphA (DoxX/SURF4 family)